MHTNLYLVEKLDRQHRQEFLAQAARNRIVAQVSNMKTTRSQTMKRIKLIAAAILVAATLVGAAPQALTASHGTAPTVASLCCYVK
jgi:hypothetical protein